MQPYNSTDTAIVWKNSHIILSCKSDFHKVINLSIAIKTLPLDIWISPSVDEILQPKYVNYKYVYYFRGLPFNEKRITS